jgi:Protein of unknown function (DUF3775)
MAMQSSIEKICFIVVTARAFEAQEEVVEDNPGSNMSDDNFREVLEAYPDDPTRDELKSFIDDLNDDEQAELVALVWLGRGDYGDGSSGWSQAVKDARERRAGSTSEYLLGDPLLPDLIEEGLDRLGLSCTGYGAEA